MAQTEEKLLTAKKNHQLPHFVKLFTVQEKSIFLGGEIVDRSAKTDISWWEIVDCRSHH